MGEQSRAVLPAVPGASGPWRDGPTSCSPQASVDPVCVQERDRVCAGRAGLTAMPVQLLPSTLPIGQLETGVGKTRI